MFHQHQIWQRDVCVFFPHKKGRLHGFIECLLMGQQSAKHTNKLLFSFFAETSQRQTEKHEKLTQNNN